MLHSAKHLVGCKVHATDGEVGTIDDVYFDDERWVIRYFAVDTGGWLTGRKVLLSPYSFDSADWDGRAVRMNLTRAQIENSPGIDAHMPVSRRQEMELFRHYGYPYYWAGPYAWGMSTYPLMMEMQRLDEEQGAQGQDAAKAVDEVAPEDRHLRSSNELHGYTIQATDDTLGHVEDLLFDAEDWSVRLIVVDPRNWWPGKHVMIPPDRIASVNWDDTSVTVSMSRTEIERSPEFDPDHMPPSGPYAMTRDAAPPGPL